MVRHPLKESAIRRKPELFPPEIPLPRVLIEPVRVNGGTASDQVFGPAEADAIGSGMIHLQTVTRCRRRADPEFLLLQCQQANEGLVLDIEEAGEAEGMRVPRGHFLILPSEGFQQGAGIPGA